MSRESEVQRVSQPSFVVAEKGVCSYSFSASLLLYSHSQMRLVLKVCDPCAVFFELSRAKRRDFVSKPTLVFQWGLDNRSAEEDTETTACAPESHMSEASLTQENPRSLLKDALP